MSAIEDLRSLDRRDLRIHLDELYADYCACLDDGEFERWPEFFTEDCLYKIVPRENYDRGLPLATWLCESRGMLQDRVVAIRQTSTYAPRYVRHIVGASRVGAWHDGAIAVQANYLVLETLVDDVTRVFQAGRYLDRIVAEDGRLRFREKLCVFDSVLVPNSLVFPI
ncbi:MAG TPA: aromatic-ring-hydroxylating dioxygenase subunit beta [Burkholderiales bacterium]|nr:aromatic-ring-hydroxylating dioxygenase subunit beta [Burkholderiales bacterium]